MIAWRNKKTKKEECSPSVFDPDPIGDGVRSIRTCATNDPSTYPTRTLSSLSLSSFEEEEEDVVDKDDHKQEIPAFLSNGSVLKQTSPKTPKMKKEVNYFEGSEAPFNQEDPLATFLDLSPTPLLEIPATSASGERCEVVEDWTAASEMDISFDVPNIMDVAEEVPDTSPEITPFSGGIDMDMDTLAAAAPEEAAFSGSTVLDQPIIQVLLTPPEKPQDYCISPPRILQQWSKIGTSCSSSFSLPSPIPMNDNVQQVVEDAIGAQDLFFKKWWENDGARHEEQGGDDLLSCNKAGAAAEKDQGVAFSTQKKTYSLSDGISRHRLCIPSPPKRIPESLLPENEDPQTSSSSTAGRAAKSSLYLLPRPTDDFETMMKEMSNMFGGLPPQPGLDNHRCGNDNEQCLSSIKNKNKDLIVKEASSGQDYTTSDLPSSILPSGGFSILNSGDDNEKQDHPSPPRIATSSSAALATRSDTVKRIPARRVSKIVPLTATLPIACAATVHSSSKSGMKLIAASSTSRKGNDRVKGRQAKKPRQHVILPVEEKPKESTFSLDCQKDDKPRAAGEVSWRMGGPQPNHAFFFKNIKKNCSSEHGDHQTLSAAHWTSVERENWQTARAATSTTVPFKTAAPPFRVDGMIGIAPLSSESMPSADAVFAAAARVLPIAGVELGKNIANEAIVPPAITLQRKQRKAPTKAPRFKNEQGETWMFQLQGATAFREKHGHCCIPCEYPENQKLATWAKRQRYMYHLLKKNNNNGSSKNRSTMTVERLRALESIGFCWEVQAAKWFAHFEELRLYFIMNGNANVSQKKQSNRKLVNWVKRQRRQFHLWKDGSHSTMNAERAKLLESVGFDWDYKTKHRPRSRSHVQQGNGRASSVLKKRKQKHSSDSKAMKKKKLK